MPAETPPPSPLAQDVTDALADGIAAMYAELKRVAASQLRRERADHTLSATGLVNEAYLRLQSSQPAFVSRAQFVGLAASAMRHILIDHARATRAEKRGGEWLKITLSQAMPEVDSALLAANGDAVDVLDIDAALTELAKTDARQAKIVELRYFGGLSIEETAAALDLSIATVKRDWLVARLFLKRHLET
jgi:RNA polymerase sigma factor (TIGR02999 family)